MPHSVYFFILGLPRQWQRLFKLVLFWPMLVAALVASKFSEEAGVRVLAWVALAGVSQADAEVAGQYAAVMLKQCLRPQLLAELFKHQASNRTVTILSGNIGPIIRPLAAELKCLCICSEAAQLSNGGFTGALAGRAMVRDRKSAYVRLQVLHHERINVYGYGNSRNDIPFLEEVGHAHAVTPDRKLRNHARSSGWRTTYFHVEESDSFWEVNRQHFQLMRIGTRLCHSSGCYHDCIDAKEKPCAIIS